MNTAPQTINLAAFVVRNGRPTMAEDAIAADRYAMYLATTHVAHPAVVGDFRAGTVHTSVARVPQFTGSVHVQVLASGRGSVEVIWDGATKTIPVTAGSGLTGAHSMADATWWSTSEPWTPTVSDAVSSKTWSFEVNDLSASATLRVYAVQLTLIAPEAGTSLP